MQGRAHLKKVPGNRLGRYQLILDASNLTFALSVAFTNIFNEMQSADALFTLHTASLPTV